MVQQDEAQEQKAAYDEVIAASAWLVNLHRQRIPSTEPKLIQAIERLRSALNAYVLPA